MSQQEVKFIDMKIALTEAQEEFCFSTAPIVWIIGGQGEGKCLGKDTPVMLYSGKIVPVQEIQVGDLLMGIDSKPRTVLSVTRGKEEMFEVVPIKGEPFRCNASHILSLKRSPDGNPKSWRRWGEIVNISVREYLDKSKKFKLHHMLYRVPVNFPAENYEKLPIPPYMLGVWLGDGNSGSFRITSKDSEIIKAVYELALSYSLKVTTSSYRGCLTYHVSAGNDYRKRKNSLKKVLDKLKLTHNKHIPHIYKTASRKNRLELLAGLIDTDGWVNHEGYQLVFKHKQLAEDTVFIARSLGLASTMKISHREIKSRNFKGIYWRVHIWGDCSVIPVRIPRKKCKPRKQKKNPLVTGIKSIKSLGIGDYYGFTLDKDCLFLLGDFTVTHNSFSAFIAMLYHAQRIGKTVKAAIVRDTFQNIKTMTIPSIQDCISYTAENYLQSDDPKDRRRFINSFKWSDGGKKLTATGLDVDLFGIDDLGALTKLQGGEYSFIWLEEPAPMFERANAGLSEEVFIAALSRVARQRGAVPRLQISMNPADEDHWTYIRAIKDPIMRPPDMPDIWTEVFFVKYGSNPFLTDLQRQTAKAAFKNNPALYRRYIEGQFAFVAKGEAVTPEYDESIHRSKEDLVPYPGVGGIRFWDGGHSPAAVVAQIHPITGRLIVYDTFMIENVGMLQLIRGLVKPAINTKYRLVKNWIDTGDPALIIRDMTDTNLSPARVIEKELNTRYVPGVNAWETRVQAIKFVLTNQPMLLLSKNEELLHRALRGGWHYQKTNEGKVLKHMAVKDRHCVDENTEILTNSGFKKYSTLSIGDSVLGYDFSTNSLINDTVKNIHIYDTPSYATHYLNQTLDMVVTEKHQCIAARRTRSSNGVENWYPPQFVTASDLHTGHQILRTASLAIGRGNRIAKDKEFSNDFIKLCAWVMTEGHYRENGQIWIGQVSKSKYSEHIKALCDKFIGAKKSILKKRKTTNSGEANIYKLKWETAYLIRFLMPNKYPTAEFINQMTQGQKRLFLFEAIKGDGDWGQDLPILETIESTEDFWFSKETPRLACSKKEEADSVQHIAFLLGIKTWINPPSSRGNYWQVSFLRMGKYTHMGQMEKDITKVPLVWCPETTTHTWVARRNGQIFITGNSHPSDAISQGLPRIVNVNVMLNPYLQKERRLRMHTEQQKTTLGYT